MMRITSILGGSAAFGLIALFAVCAGAQSKPVIQGSGCYSGNSEQAASNACGEGGAPSGPVGPAAVAPQNKASGAPGSYDSKASNAASSNAGCGVGGAPFPTANAPGNASGAAGAYSGTSEQAARNSNCSQ